MPTDKSPSAIQTLHVCKEQQISAPIDIVFETLLEPQGRLAEMGLKLEPVAWRPLVSRFGQQRRSPVGARAGDQAAHAARD